MSRTPVLTASVESGRDDAHAPPFRCSWTDGPNTALVHLAGVLDFATVSQFARTLRKLGEYPQLIVLDLRQLELIDSFGVHAIANASSKARAIGRRLVLLRGAPEVDRMFTLAGRLEDVEIGDLGSEEPADHALLRFAT